MENSLLTTREFAEAVRKEARCRLAFLQHSLLNMDGGDGVLEGAAGVADDIALAVLDAVQTLERRIPSSLLEAEVAEPDCIRRGAG